MSPSAIPPIHPVYKIASIPGDGIGPEVISAGIEVLNTLASTYGTFSFEFTHFDWSSDRYKSTGEYIPPGGLDELKKFHAILFGAVGAPDVPDHISLWSLRLAICQPLDQYANVRPTRILRGITPPLTSSTSSPKNLDWVIIRENSEGEYAGHGGRSHRNGHPHETATETSIFTRVGVSRIMRFAFQTARSRPRRKITIVTKSNAQRNGMVLWDEIAKEVSAEFPDVECDKMLVDAMTARMVLHPETIDTIVATNLHADILSDLAAALAGSIGIAPTSNLDPERRNPSMFEPIHGSAMDIAGQGIANPVGTFWTCAEMVRWLNVGGEGGGMSVGTGRQGDVVADHLIECVERVMEKGVRTRDLGGKNNTKEVTEAVCEEVRRGGGKVLNGSAK
jgi:tartrate dehydrogenase